MVSLLRHGWTDASGLSAATGIAPWFTERLAELVEAERDVVGAPLLDAKRAGFGDADIAHAVRRAAGGGAARPRAGRHRAGLPARGHLRRRVPGRDAVLLQLLRHGRGAAAHRIGAA